MKTFDEKNNNIFVGFDRRCNYEYFISALYNKTYSLICYKTIATQLSIANFAVAHTNSITSCLEREIERIIVNS